MLDDLFAAEPLDALVILSPNVYHFPYAIAAIERGLHALCEKPLAMTSGQARQLTEAAERAGVTTMTPFTYRFMPVTRYLKELVDERYIGRPYHLNMRYYANYGRSGEYIWRFNLDQAGAGASGDLGSHWVYLARWFYSEIAAVTAVFGHAVPRAPRPTASVSRRRAFGDDPAAVRERGNRLAPRLVRRARGDPVRASAPDVTARQRRHALCRQRLGSRPAGGRLPRTSRRYTSYRSPTASLARRAAIRS